MNRWSRMVAVAGAALAACGGAGEGWPQPTTPPSASRSSLTVEVAGAPADGATAIRVTARVLDADGAAVRNALVVFAASGAGAAWSPPLALSDADGVAVAALTTAVAGDRIVSASASGVPIAETRAVAFAAAPSPALSTLVVSAPILAADGTTSTRATVTVRDHAGAIMAGVPVEFSHAGAAAAWARASPVSAPDGTATAAISSAVAGRRILSVRAGGVALAQTRQVVFVSVVSPTLSSLEASATWAAADGLQAVPVAATVRDHSGAVMAGVTVRFAAAGGAAGVSPPSAVTDAAGVARATVSATAAGVRTIQAAVGGVTLVETRRVTFAATAAPDLRITEVGNAWYYDVPAWIEVYNGTGAPVDLAAYQLRAGAVDPSTGREWVGAVSFALPAHALQPGAFAVLVARGPWSGADGGGVVHVGSTTRTPYWLRSGFVELTRANATVDFVRFGSSTAAPTTPSGWSGSRNAPGFPAAPEQYHVALARRPIEIDTNTAADWVQVGFPTPGGPNDVAPGAVSSDGDGIPDSAKVPGGTYAGLDLYAMGARAGQRDVFLELDAMDSADPGVVPRREAIEMVIARFAAHGIALHVDAGDRFAAAFDPAGHNLGQAVPTVPYAACVTFPQAVAAGTTCAGNVYTYRARYMDVARRAVFHYALFGSSQDPDGGPGPSGRADIVGSHLLVTLGAWGLSTTPGAQRNALVNFQAGTLMHELGHNLGLRHGGDEDQNFKPNYLSVMNYLYQMAGLPDPASSSAGDRYFYYYPSAPIRRGALEGLDAGPHASPSQFRLDFSSGSAAPLDERALAEGQGLGTRGAAAVDFDGDGGTGGQAHALSLNPQWSDALSPLRDHDDWANLRLPFQPMQYWVIGSLPADVPPAAAALPAAHFADRLREASREDAPDPSFFRELRGGAAAAQR